MNYLTGTIAWSPEYVGDDVDGWLVLGSPGNADLEPSTLANVGREVRSAEVSLYEGTWYVRVVPVYKAGGYGDWREVTPEEIAVAAREEAPPEPTDAAVAFVDNTSTARVVDEPPVQKDAQPYYQEVIVGPDADRGHLVAEHGIEPAGPLMPDGQRRPSPAFPLESIGAGSTVDVLVRNVGAGGRTSSAVSKTIATPPDTASKFHDIPIVALSGSTHTGLANSTSTTGWEFDAADGLRLKAFPAVSGMTADWTTILNANEYLSDYVDNAMVESDEVDLGGTMTVRLSSSHTAQRKTATGSFATRSGAMYMDPVDPLQNPAAARAAMSPLWIGREVGSDGKPRRPIRPQDCEVRYIISGSSGFAHARADYKSMVDGAFVRGRYIRVALFLREPFGGYQLICPRWTVSAQVMRSTTVGTATPESAVSAPPGSTFVRTDAAPYVYVKASGVGSTGWKAANDGTNATLLGHADSQIDVVSTASETTLWSQSIPSMAGGDRLRLTVVGDYLNNTGAGATLAVKITFGSTIITNYTSISIAANAARRALQIDFMLAAYGATNAQRGGGQVHIGAISNASTGTGQLAPNAVDGTFQAGTSTEDTTSPKTLTVAVTHSSSSASLSCRAEFATLEHLRA